MANIPEMQPPEPPQDRYLTEYEPCKQLSLLAQITIGSILIILSSIGLSSIIYPVHIQQTECKPQ